ncbi:small subunit processome component 20 homolog isoform X2 [Rhodnius prolixus]
MFLIKTILKSLKKNRDGIEGSGRLICEILRGVPGHFHSCAEKTLNSLFTAVNEKSFPQELVWQILHCTVSNIVKYIYVEHISVLWKIVFEYLHNFYALWRKDNDECSTKNVKEILNTILQIVEAKDCKYLLQPEKILESLLPFVESKNPEIIQTVSQIFTPVLLAPSLTITQDLSKRYLVTAITYFDDEIKVTFISNLFSYKQFDKLLLPLLLDFCESITPEKSLTLLTNIILYKAPPARNGEELLKWTPYVLNLSSTNYSDAYLSKLSEPSDRFLEEFENSVKILAVLPHIKPIEKKVAIVTIKTLIEFLCKYISELQQKECFELSMNHSVYLLCSAIETLFYLKPEESFTEICCLERVLNIILPFADAKHLYVLRVLDFCIVGSDFSAISPVLPLLYDKLSSSLLSPYNKVRELAIHMLYNIEKSNTATKEIMVSLLEMCWKAEITPTTLNDYREKLKFLQKLDPTNESVQVAIVNDIIDYNLILKFLLGMLYVNFKLMWEPISQLIISYLNMLKPNQIWTVFGSELSVVGKMIREQIEEPKVISIFQCKNLDDIYINLNGLEEKPDHVNHRILLWTILAECVHVCEVKNRDIVILFFSFLEEEYWKRHSDLAKTWDISLASKEKDLSLDESLLEIKEKQLEKTDENQMDVDVNHLAIDENQMEVCEEKEVYQINVKADVNKELAESDLSSVLKFKAITKTLLVHMRVLGKFRSPKNIYREADLHKIYIDFLSHKAAEVQKAALDCLMTYKHKFLFPYREHLYGLIDDKTFKNEITVFRIDTESEVLRPEHRSDLIPFVLRIVYSKMYTRTNTVKGVNRQDRKASVIRFLAGCSPEELICFFKMVFAAFHGKVEKIGNILELAERTISELELECVIPPKKMQSQIYLLNTVLIYCGGLLGRDHQNYLLRILISVSGHLAGIFQMRERVHPCYLRTLRDIKNTSFEALIKFYEKFETYEWTLEETEAVFKVFIWPYLKKLPIEGIHSPTAQLKLFSLWSKNPRYFVLLGKYLEDDKNLAPLRFIIELWLSPKIHGSVYNTILDLIENMFVLQQDDTSEFKRIEVKNPPLLCKEKLSTLKQSLNYGSILLVPYIPDILELFQRKLSTKQGLNRKEVEILSRMTELVTDPDSADKLLNLLIPRLIKKSGSSEDVIIPLLSTAYNLIKYVINPGRYVRKLAPLYGSVEGPAARKLLFSIVIDLSKQEGSESGLDEGLLGDLNAWDVKWIDQPDFNRRLNAFKKLEEMANEKNISVNLGIIVIYTCFFFVKTEKDLSLKENSKYCLQKICPALCHSLQDNNRDRNFVIGTILYLVTKGLSDKQTESVRNDSIYLLGHMARECSALHPVLHDLSYLGNKIDMEVDFFENLQHLQLHRRVRAFLKFATVADTLDKPMNPRTLTEFIIPLISQYLLCEKYSKKNSLIDSAIKALGTVCRMLPWRQYQSILTLYIHKLQENIEYQKQLVRIVIEVLNAFHFDLTLADMACLEKRVVKSKSDNDFKLDQEKIDPKHDEIESVVPKTTSTLTEEDESEINFEDELEKDIGISTDDISDVSQTNLKALDQTIKLTNANATRVIKLIAETLLPQLQKTLAQRTQTEVQHKLNRKTTGPDRDEEDVLRVPLAVAVVKLLQKLPTKKMLDTNLPGIFMKLCTFLKSRLDSVRRVTRETLQTIMLSLGCDYLPLLIHEMSTLLTKGFHVHVLVYSVHSVLKVLTPHFKQGSIDACIHSLLKICSLDLFGHASEEKEVNQILGKVFEARANRSYDVYHILATYASENYLLNIILPLKEELSRTMSHKYVSKVRECLQQVVLGLTENAFISPESLLQFAYGTASESIPALTYGMKKEPVDPKQAELEARKQPDSFLIPNEPKKKKALESFTCSQTNANLLVEFGLRLFYFLFKREKLKAQNYADYLDPVVLVLSDCIKSQHVKVSILAIQCLCWVLKMDLPSVRLKIKEITVDLFSVLHKYACAGLSNKGDNYDLVMITFKAVAVIVRDVKHFQLEPDQIRALLLYCEQDLDDYSRQVTAFSLLKAIIKKKIDAPELLDVMKKVGDLSISSNQDSIRLQARQVMLHFLMEYSLGNRVEYFVSFYLSQLNYSHETGRASSLEMLRNITNAFPIKELQANCAAIFVNVSTSLVNDPQPECRKQAAQIIGLLLGRIDNNCKDKLFDVTKLWLEDSKKSHRRLAAQIIGLFVAAEREKFEKRLLEILPLILRQFVDDFQEKIPGRFVLLNPPVSVSNDETISDHHMYHVLHMLVKIASICPNFLKNQQYLDYIETIGDSAQSLLGHAHEWVRQAAVQLLGQIVSATPAIAYAEAINDPSLERPGFMLTDCSNKLRSLTLDLTSQLISSEEVNEKFLTQCMKLLVYIAEIMKSIKLTDDVHSLSLMWLVKRIRKKINYEVIHSPKSIIVRKMCFNWIAAVAVKLLREELEPIASSLLFPLVREMSLVEDNSLKKSAKEAASYVKSKLGNDTYQSLVADITRVLEIKKADRRKERSQLMVTDPERAAKRKIQKQLKKRGLKKRKIELIKKQKYKKKRKQDVIFED